MAALCSLSIIDMCITYAFWPMYTANVQAVNALGHSDISIRLEIIRKYIGVVILGLPFLLALMSWSRFS